MVLTGYEVALGKPYVSGSRAAGRGKAAISWHGARLTAAGRGQIG